MMRKYVYIVISTIAVFILCFYKYYLFIFIRVFLFVIRYKAVISYHTAYHRFRLVAKNTS